MRNYYDIIFTVYGNPKALKRHRTFRKGNSFGTYDPSKKDKADFLAIAQKYRPERPIMGAIHINLIFSFTRPASHFGTGKNGDKLKPSSPKHHITKPDTDNLVKFVIDSLNGIFWLDDKQITTLYAEKQYSEKAFITVKIKKLDMAE